MPEPTAQDKIAKLVDANTRSGLLAIPQIPYFPPSESVVKRFPEIGKWYDEFFRRMEKWREESDRALRGAKY